MPTRNNIAVTIAPTRTSRSLSDRRCRSADERYADDGHLEIYNNAAERALRVVALGRKNYLFAGSDSGGARVAAIYSLLGTAKLIGLDPELHLEQVLARIADHPVTRIHDLLPWNLSLTHKYVST